MKRLLSVVVAGALAASATQANAQEMIDRRASLFDLGVYAGGAWTSSWFEINDEGFQVGLSPIFGATATYWASPSFGVRLHGAYFPSDLPEADTDIDDDLDDDNNWPMNNWLYDLDLVFRPWFASAGGNLMASTYLFVGGGGLTTNIAGEGKTPGGAFICRAEYFAGGVCLSPDPEYASVGQGVVGLGFDLFPLTSGLGIFGELAVHGYDSPAHVFNETTAADKFAFTPRAVLGLKFMFGDILPPPPPEPVVVPPPVEAPPVPPAPVEQAIRVCVVEGTMLREVEAMYNPATGDTMVAGQPFATAFPATTPTYAAGATWYINNEPIQFMNRRYVKFGLPRVVSPTDLRHIGEYQGTPVFADATATGTPDVVYIPVRPGCEFQPYQYEVPARGVRG